MSLGMEVGLGPGNIVLDGNPTSTSRPKMGVGHSSPPQISAHVYCGQTAVWIKMPFGTDVGLVPGHIVLDGDTSPKEAQQPLVFGPCILWLNGWMDQDTTCYKHRLQTRRHCVTWKGKERKSIYIAPF